MDEKLRRRFERLRVEESAQAPDYAEFVARSPRTSARPAGFSGPLLALSAAAVLALALWWGATFVTSLREAEAPRFSPGEWAMPTDVLLDLPGLATPPRFGLPIDSESIAPVPRSPWRNTG